MSVKEPLEWKSEIWWRNRPVEERLGWLHLPPRIARDMDDGTVEQWVADWHHGKSLFICGPSDTGKSLRAARLLKALIECLPVSGRWIEADTYIQMIKDSFDNDGQLGEEYSSPFTLKNVKGVFDVVVLDGLGDERKTDFAAHEIGSLIRGRYDRLKSTIITSRLTIADISARYGERLAAPMASFDLESTHGRQ